MGKWERTRSLEGFGRAQELGNNPEGIRPNYFSSDDVMDEADEIMRMVNGVDLPTDEPSSLANTRASKLDSGAVSI